MRHGLCRVPCIQGVAAPVNRIVSGCSRLNTLFDIFSLSHVPVHKNYRNRTLYILYHVLERVSWSVIMGSLAHACMIKR